MGTSASIPSRESESGAFKRDSELDATLDSNIDQSLEYETNSRPSANEDDYYGQEEEEKEEDEDKQLKIRREHAFQVLNTAIDTIHKIHSKKDNNINWMDDLGEVLQRIEAVYEEIGNIYNSAYDVALRYRRKAGKKMCETKTTKVMFDVVMDCWRVCSINKDDTNVKKTIDVLNSAISILWNFSDSTPGVSCEIVKEQRFIATLKEILTSYQPSTNRKDDKKTRYEYHWMKGALAIVYNVSQVDQTIPRLRSLGIVATINPYLDANDDELRLIALATLANIIDEEQSEVLKDKHDAIQLLLTTLELALTNDAHRYKGWTARECALCVRRLARNDANKKPLVEMGCLHQLVKLAKCKTFEEQREAVGAIWILAFNKDNQRKILEHTDLQIIELLANLKEKSEDKEVRKAADSILWILREQLQNYEKYKHIANSYIKKSIPNSTEKDRTERQVLRKKNGHVMISYNWGHQKELIKISEILKEKGFPVWMDIKNMSGSTLQDMAEAVENARVVLVCYSRKYKDSPNCRAEAEYAFEERKEIIPLKMDRDYKRDGWLAMVITGKLFIDFSGKYTFEDKIKELCERLASSFEREDADPIENQTMRKSPTIREQAEDVVDGGPVADTPRTVSYSAPKGSVASLRKWTSTDVDNWINKHNLPRKEFGRLTGRDLAGLIIMRAEAPECFYSCLKTDLKIKSFATIDMFIEALGDLPN